LDEFKLISTFFGIFSPGSDNSRDLIALLIAEVTLQNSRNESGKQNLSSLVIRSLIFITPALAQCLQNIVLPAILIIELFQIYPALKLALEGMESL